MLAIELVVRVGVGYASAYLDEVLSFWLRNERLELGCGKGVDETSLGDDKEEHLSASEDGQFICLL